jgi:hypothetical protein
MASDALERERREVAVIGETGGRRRRPFAEI